jgi:hypothetical protein
MTSILVYWLWPNPGIWLYSTPIVKILLSLGGGLFVASFLLASWRRRLKNPTTRTLSASWPSLALWFGITLVVLVVARVESIQFVAMRLWILLWALLAVLTVVLHALRFRSRHYTVVSTTRIVDERDRYLPKRGGK